MQNILAEIGVLFLGLGVFLAGLGVFIWSVRGIWKPQVAEDDLDDRPPVAAQPGKSTVVGMKR